jgi:quercetin dioxygenase-like cupin family protein
MTTQRIANQFFLGCSILAMAAAFSMPAFAGEAQFVNVFDKSKMKATVPGAMMGELIGRNISIETFYAGGASAPLSAGKSHHHPEEHVWFQMAGESDYRIEFGDGKKREFNKLGAGVMMHIPAGQQHRGGHGAADHFMVMVTSPSRASTVTVDAPDKRCFVAEPTNCTVAPATTPVTRDHFDMFDFKETELTALKKGRVYVRQGKLGDGLGEEAVLIKKKSSTDYIVSAQKPPAEEVAIVYSGHVRVTGCGETRNLGPGDVFYCPGALAYSGLGTGDSQVLRIFSPANPDFFIAKP